MSIDFNPIFQKAVTLLEDTSQNIFITGRAGTGKSTLLSYFREHTKKNVVVLAPTGVAALNIKGQTIHSFFKFKPDITLEKVKAIYKKDDPQNIYQKLELIIIDEISMVRSDLLDCVDKSLRLNRGKHEPFGGVQMIFIGDLYQLPPVVTRTEAEIFLTQYASPYFFDAQVMQGLPLEFVELEKIYRQKDDTFISLLNAVRNNSATEEHFAAINERYNPEFVPNSKKFFLYLTTTNARADEINSKELTKLKTSEHLYEGNATGNFDNRAMPTDAALSVKVGAQIMMLNNDSAGRWVNGSIGKIVSIEKDEEGEDLLIAELSDGELVEVARFTWELFEFKYDADRKSMHSETIGTFTQYPLKLAWAVTIHKSQGKTFDQIIIDLGKGTFAHGQLYVALSRCRTLAGIILKQPVLKQHIRMDWRVVKFITQFHYARSDAALALSEKVRILENAASEQSAVRIVYLKANDEKSERTIVPYQVGEMDYRGKKFLGVSAFDKKRGEDRVFRIDRILEM
jgi:ATP-dependent exoDNAse (exonuclease V) alpha subunit